MAITVVRPAARRASLSPRLLQLSEPRTTSPMHFYPREDFHVSKAALNATASENVLSLSTRRLRRAVTDLDLGHPSESIRPVSRAALEASASPAIVHLASPKKSWGETTEFNRHMGVSPAALTARASERIGELAVPRKRSDFEEAGVRVCGGPTDCCRPSASLPSPSSHRR